MAKNVLLLRHMPNERDDRVSRWLKQNDYSVETCRPFDGDSLPGDESGFDAVVVYGGVQSANDASGDNYLIREIRWIERWIADDLPFLGICLGGQLLARALGARVFPHPDGLHEVGYRSIKSTNQDDLFFSGDMRLYQWHKEGFDTPEDAVELATGDDFPCQAYRYRNNVYGFQFHPEVDRNLMIQWMSETGPESLQAPGADVRHRQLADAQRFDYHVDQWISGFLLDWLN